ncbi:RNA polymerase sigma-70 factor, ECF subfamily [Micromonospora pattaloongensis]|uniref:RNA polymerase sigma-70 factor, ECF subfamily n=1 Tax=Micromonospora pattaloongensis TaxID=405436 RepID=A0A1H3PUV4_9ACTN|nr:SigE family RNA polymerase sigma factor [Micromonospora pattaloongensis]SDZ04836.1 RNA polymerase sigma-70 factor, ECF subfamily [Micromonospora pattaloongensis]
MGTTDDFDAFYTATSARVVHQVYAVCGNLSEAQDAVQEAYARAWIRWSWLSGYEDPEAWVRTVAWRVAANRWRSVRRWLAARARLGPPVTVAEPSPDRIAVMAALRRLPEAQRRVVVLHYLCDLPIAEIAETTRMPAGTVKVYLARARAALAPLLGTHDERKESDVSAHP